MTHISEEKFKKLVKTERTEHFITPFGLVYKTFIDLGYHQKDCSYFMERVQQNGGRAAYLMYGTEIAAGHHNSCFDFDEKCLYKAVAMLTELAIAYTNK